MQKFALQRCIACSCQHRTRSVRPRGLERVSIRLSTFNVAHGPLPRCRVCAVPQRNSGEEEISQAATLVDTMAREMLQELFVGSATNYVTGEEAMKDEVSSMLERVVSPKLDDMPPAVLPMIDAYIEAIGDEQSNVDTLRVLLLIKGFILEKLESRLPESMQMLQRIVDAARDNRIQLYESAAEKEGGLVDVYNSCNRLIQTIEDQSGEIVDLVLLCKLCLARYEMGSIIPPGDIEQTMKNRFTAIGGVPEDDSAFLKELLNVSDPMKRVHLIKSSITEQDARRPGRFIDCVVAVQQGMVSGTDTVDNEAVYARLNDIIEETMKVLEDISGDVTLMP
jgi:hypothetical protein